MKLKKIYTPVTILILIISIVISQSALSKDIVRPEEIKSKRLVILNDDSYVELARHWNEYYEAYPSEYAYANWMYAARYAGDENYTSLLNEGIDKYPANPTILYLKGLEHCGMEQDIEGLKYLEKAVDLDPKNYDSWFALAINYMESRENEKLTLALRKLLESGIIADEIMDYNYNVLMGLEKNGIIITNGDNDTYPIWILIKILGIRPDVTIVNRSLLNTAWYPLYMIEQGLPRFISKIELEELREEIPKLMRIKGHKVSPAGPFGDNFTKKIIKSAKNAGRPVYLAKTMYITGPLKYFVAKGHELGLAILVSKSKSDYGHLLRYTYEKWLDEFRTGGLTSWRLQNAPSIDAGHFIVPNYAFGIASNLEAINKHAPELCLKLFHWYKKYIENLLSEDHKYRMAYTWSCYASDIKEIDDWCKKQGINCKESEKP